MGQSHAGDGVLRRVHVGFGEGFLFLHFFSLCIVYGKTVFQARNLAGILRDYYSLYRKSEPFKAMTQTESVAVPNDVAAQLRYFIIHHVSFNQSINFIIT